MVGVEDLLRLTVAALMTRTDERQNDLADGLGLSQAQVSRKQGGHQHWSLEDVDRLGVHFGLHFLDLLAGPTHAVGVLHGSIPALRPTDAGAPTTAAPAPAALFPVEPVVAVAPAPVAAPARVEPVGLCVLCGQPCAGELDGWPQHFSAEECAAAIAAASPTSTSTPAPSSAPVPAPVQAPPLPTEPAVRPARSEPAPAPAPELPAPAPGLRYRRRRRL
ncbi:hypothetical protein [Streptomyces sp. NPDC055005]